MRKITLLFCLTLVLFLVSPHELFAQWSENRVMQQNRYAPRAHFMSYSIIENALSKEYGSSRNFISLNGKWRFKQYDTLAKVSLNSNEDLSSYADITIPADWSSVGLDDCRVGVYRSRIEIPALWLDKEIFLVLSQASSSAKVYVNGSQVGFLQDSEGSAEYLISKYIHTGVNELAIVVSNKSDGALLDHPSSKAGITGDCYIFAQPKTRINNFEVTSTLDSTFTHGLLDVAIEVFNSYNSDETVLVGYDILDSKGEIVTYNNREITIKANSVDTVTMSTILSNVKAWSSESPNLYTLFFRVRQQGRYIEFFTHEIGFRSVDMKNREILVNGKPILIKGVFYNDVPTTSSGSIDQQGVKRDLAIMKRYGINTLYTSIQSPLFYRLCDSYGLYVCSEINLHPQSSSFELANNPSFKEAFVTRVQSAYQTLRNYPCVIMWSLGTGNLNGYNFYKAYQSLKEVDKNRPILFMGAALEVNTDILSLKADQLSNLSSLAKSEHPGAILLTDPQSIADLSTIWGFVQKTPLLQGGFIADFVGENSVVKKSREATKQANELQSIFHSIRFTDEDLDRGKFKLTNLSNFEDLSSYDITYHILKKGVAEPLAKGNLKGAIAPNGGSKSYQIPIKVYVPLSDKTPYYVRFIVKTKENTPALAKGTIVYMTDLKVPNKR